MSAISETCGNMQLTGKAAEFGNCVEIPLGLRGEELPAIPEEVYVAVPEKHTRGKQLINVAEDNSRKTPVMLHRAIVGSLERFK